MREWRVRGDAVVCGCVWPEKAPVAKQTCPKPKIQTFLLTSCCLFVVKLAFLGCPWSHSRPGVEIAMFHNKQQRPKPKIQTALLMSFRFS